MRKLLAIPPIAVLLVCTACGTSSGPKATVTHTVTASPAAAASDSPPASSSAAAANPDACSLLTQAQAEAIAGTPLMQPVGAGADSTGAHVQCQWTGPTSGPTAQVEVYVGDGALKQLQIDRDNLKHTFMTVPGIGDQCVQEEGFIFAEKNGLWASIRLVRLDDSALHVTPLQVGMKELTAQLP